MKSNKTKDIAYVAAGVTVITLCAWISIPVQIPFTLQTFAIFTVLGVLGGKLGTFSVLTYIVIGALGAPVFAGFKGGVGVLLNSTGGYIIGFLVIALIMWLFEKLFGKKQVVFIASSAVGLILCYAFGTAWFMFLYTKGGKEIALTSVLMSCVVPYIIPDIIKIGLSVIVKDRLKKALKL